MEISSLSYLENINSLNAKGFLLIEVMLKSLKKNAIPAEGVLHKTHLPKRP